MTTTRLGGWIVLIAVLLGLSGLVYFGGVPFRGQEREATGPDTAEEAPGPIAEAPDEASPGPGEPAAPADVGGTADAGAAPGDRGAGSEPAAGVIGDQAAASGTGAVITEAEPGESAAEDTAAEAPEVPGFDIVRVEPSGDTVIAGVAEPGARVEILDGDTTIASTEANDRGEWAVALDRPLAPGAHDLAVRSRPAGDGGAALSDERIAVLVPDSPSEAPLVVLNTPDAPSAILQMPEPAADADTARAGEAGAAIAAAPPAAGAPGTASAAGPPPAAASAGGPEPAAGGAETAALAATSVAPEPVAIGEPGLEVGISAVEADPSGSVFIAGTATASDPVRVYLDGELVGEAEPTPGGTWLLETRRELAPGAYTVRADQVGPDGRVTARAEVPFEREADVASLRPMMQAGGRGGATASGEIGGPARVIIKRGDNLWRISRGIYGRGIRYSTIYQANKDQIRDPHWIYPGQVFVLPSEDESWEE